MNRLRGCVCIAIKRDLDKKEKEMEARNAEVGTTDFQIVDTCVLVQFISRRISSINNNTHTHTRDGW